MVRYKLGFFVNKEVKIIDLDSLKKIKNLQSLDKFTSSFANENELKIYLFNHELLSKLEMKYNVVVTYKNNGREKKIPVVYQDANKLLDVVDLKYKLMSMKSNMQFLEKLADFYSNGSTKYNKQGLNVSDIRTYLSDVRYKREEIHSYLLLENALDALFKKAVFKIDRNTGEVEINYRGMRDLALFIYKFENNLEKNKIKEEQSNETWVQESLFDIEKKSSFEVESNLSSAFEPDFPPNSEEEARYQAYQDKLDKLYNQNIDPYDEFYETKKR